MQLSVGVLYSSQELLRIVHDGGVRLDEFDDMFRKIEVADAKVVLELSQQCNWLRVSESGTLVITERGTSILSAGGSEHCLRQQLADAIGALNPPWARKITLGRFEVLKVLPRNVAQCFRDCALLEGTADEVVRWWDVVGRKVRSDRAEVLSNIGRIAEKSTLMFEELRVKEPPTWQSIESSVSGYDVLSRVEPEDPRKLKIEVKGSTMRLSDAVFTLTRNEWDTALNSEHYHFHLWLLHDTHPKFFLVPGQNLDQFVPQDRKSGRWQNAHLYFREFKAFECEFSPKIAEGIQSDLGTLQ